MLSPTSATAPTVKLTDEYPPGSRNFCIHPAHRHLVKPSLFSLVHSSPVTSSLNPTFSPFLLPLDDQPLLLVVLSVGCTHRHDVVGERLKDHEGKDRVVGLVRLAVEDVVKMAVIQQREWDVDVYAMVEREREKERRREGKAREVERRRARGEVVDEGWEAEEEREEEQVERAAADKHRVSVLMKQPAQLEREREARRAKREAKRRRAGTAPVPVGGVAGGVDEDSSDDSDDDEEEGGEGGEGEVVLGGAVPMISFFSLAFFTTRPVLKEEMGLADYTAEVRRESGSKVGGVVGTGTGLIRGPAFSVSGNTQKK